MRIGMMTDIYKPYVSGVTNHISLTKQHLEAANHEVYIFTFGEEDDEDGEDNVIRSSGLPVTVPVAEMDTQLNLRYSREAKELLHTMDLVHVHHPFLSGQLALRYCRPRRIPVVFTNHTRYDLYYQAYLPWMPDGLGETFLRSYLPPFCRAVDQVVAPSAGLRDVLQHLDVDVPIEVLPNGVDLAPIQAYPQAYDRAALGFTKQDVVLLYVGRLGPEKNLPFLLRSFAGVNEAYGNLKLVLVGDGPERSNLEDRAEMMEIGDLVHFAGLVEYQHLPAYLKMADVFATASVTEVHPLTVIEAMAAGLPVLGVHSPGVGDTVVDGVSGLLSSDDLAAYTAKMIRMVTEHEARQQMSIQAMQAAEQYAIERTSDLLLECYQAVLERSRQQERPWYTDVLRFYDEKKHEQTP